MPMECEWTDEQQQIKRMVRECAEAEIKPRVMEWDEAQHLPKDLFVKMFREYQDYLKTLPPNLPYEQLRAEQQKQLEEQNAISQGKDK